MTRKGLLVALGAVGIVALVASVGILSVVQADVPWEQEAQLIVPDGALSDQFGFAVAVSGDTAVMGTSLDDVGGNADQGSAYVFVRTGAALVQLTASDGAADDQFGFAVAISGDTAVVGAYLDDVSPNNNQGAAYVFVRTGDTWSQQAKLTASDGAAADIFGWSVAISGDTVVVGASQDAIGGNIAQGSAYVFMRSGTTWSQQAKLTASDGAAYSYFGGSVAINGDTAVVSADDDVGGNINQGSAYVFVRSGTTWTQQAELRPPTVRHLTTLAIPSPSAVTR